MISSNTTLQRNSSQEDSVQLVCLSSNERCKVNDMIKYYTTRNSSDDDCVQLVYLSSTERCKVNDMIKYYTTKE